MTSSSNKSITCLQCRQVQIEKSVEYWPFCSKRCQLLDLEKWGSEKYRIAGEKVQVETSEENSDRYEEE